MSRFCKVSDIRICSDSLDEGKTSVWMEANVVDERWSSCHEIVDQENVDLEYLLMCMNSMLISLQRIRK